MLRNLKVRKAVRTCVVASFACVVLLTSCRHSYDSPDVPRHASEQEKARARETLGEQQSMHPTDDDQHDH